PFWLKLASAPFSPFPHRAWPVSVSGGGAAGDHEIFEMAREAAGDAQPRRSAAESKERRLLARQSADPVVANLTAELGRTVAQLQLAEETLVSLVGGPPFYSRGECASLAPGRKSCGARRLAPGMGRGRRCRCAARRWRPSRRTMVTVVRRFSPTASRPPFSSHSGRRSQRSPFAACENLEMLSEEASTAGHHPAAGSHPPTVEGFEGGESAVEVEVGMQEEFEVGQCRCCSVVTS
ncbi:unnamed protein product, partial [Prorocentrum cordatum]